MKIDYKLKITHLYPDYMNIYGDIGNIITLVKRCKWRDIDVQVRPVTIRGRLPRSTDIFFLGGGQDRDQLKVSKDFIRKKKSIIKLIENNVLFLAICGGLQLLGNYFIAGDGTKIEGIGAVNLYTESPDDSVKSRCIGNVVARLNPDVFPIDRFAEETIVGFENHIGQTYLDESVTPLATIIKGKGNNVVDKYEGFVYRKVIGTYLHGSFLPKNPHIADWIILNALKRKYGDKAKLKKLDDNEEIIAHRYIINRLNG